METAWINYIHDVFGHDSTKASQRQKHLLWDVFANNDPVEVSKRDHLSPRLAKAYAGLNPKTCLRDVDILKKRGFLLREGKTIRANKALIAEFLPVRANVQPISPDRS